MLLLARSTFWTHICKALYIYGMVQEILYQPLYSGILDETLALAIEGLAILGESMLRSAGEAAGACEAHATYVSNDQKLAWYQGCAGD